MQAAYKRRRDLSVCGVVGVCATTREELVDEIMSIPVIPVSASIVLVGVPAIVMAKEDAEIRKMYNEATIAAIDGMPIVKLARKKGLACERCSGEDIFGPIIEKSIAHNKTHYFYGGKNENILKMLRDNLEKLYPGIKIVGMYSPPFRPLTDEEDKYVCDEINRLHPDFIWVGIGAPKQEIWIQEHRSKIQGSVMLGIGAVFDFLAGTLKMAPKWVVNAGFEWLFRLISEPKRLWKRYIIGGAKYLYYSVTYKLERLYK